MAHAIDESTLSPAQRKFLDLMNHGDDLLKIELLRPAKTWYKRALEMHMETDKVMRKIAECDRLIRFEQKVIAILAAVAAIIVLVAYLLG